MIQEDGDGIDRIKCDSCHVQIAYCQFFTFEEGQELVYSPILCEKCGNERSKDHGDKTKLIGEINKMIEELLK